MSILLFSFRPRRLRLYGFVLALLLVSIGIPTNTNAQVTITDLGALSRDCSWATDINDLGYVVGTACTQGFSSIFVSYNGGGMAELASEVSAHNARINNNGKIAFTLGRFDIQPAITSISSGNKWSLLPSLSNMAGAIDINDQGDVLGYYEWDGQARPIIWRNNGDIFDLTASLGSGYPFHSRINNVGQVIAQGVLWSPNGTIQQIGGSAYGLNNLGQVVGQAGNTAFLWSATEGMITLGTLGGSSSRALGVNDLGQVVGSSITETGSTHAFVWSATQGMIDLGTLDGGTFSEAVAINEKGQVAGNSDSSMGGSRAVLWTVPPPSPAPPTTHAADTFNRTLTSGWGKANTGGSWGRAGDLAKFAVTGTTGTMKLTAANTTLSQTLWSVSARDVDLRVRVKFNKLPAGGSQIAYLIARRTGQSTQYHGRLRFATDGKLYLQAERWLNGYNKLLANEVSLAGVAPVANGSYWLRMQVSGVSPTVIRLKAWQDGQAEPGNWAYTARDDTAELQQAGAVGLRAYVAKLSTAAPVVATFDDFSVTSLKTP